MSSREPRLHLPSAGMTDTCCHACFMTWTLGIQTQVLELVWEGRYYLSHLPSLGYLPSTVKTTMEKAQEMCADEEDAVLFSFRPSPQTS